MNNFTGTFRLVRLALRRDRIKLPIALAAVGLSVPMMVSATQEIIDTTNPEATHQLVSFLAANPATRLFGLPTGSEYGEILMLRIFTTLAVVAAMVSTFTLIRHTRQNEERGRSELIGSNVVGRHASLTAALIVVLGVNILFAALIFAGLMTGGLVAQGAFAMAVAIGAAGAAFGAVAAVCAQLTKTSRGANSLAALTVGVGFLSAGIGSVLGRLQPNGVDVEPMFAAWLSPIGWGQLMRPFTANNWTLLVVFGIFITACVAVSLYLTSRRDVGSGIFPGRAGRAHAKPGMLSIPGITKRLNKGMFLGWLAGITLLGAIYGVVASSVEDLLSQAEGFEEVFVAVAGSDEIVLAFFGSIMGIIGVFTLAYAVQAALRLRAEENRALEFLLSTSVSRTRWLLANVAYVAVTAALIMLAAGLAAGLIAELTLSGDVDLLLPIIAGAMVQIPAILLMVGFVVAIFGIIPRLSHALAWTAVSITVAFSPFFSALFNVPDWIINVSPLSHTPVVPPTDNVELLPLVALSGIALLLLIVGAITFRKRDITTE